VPAPARPFKVRFSPSRAKGGGTRLGGKPGQKTRFVDWKFFPPGPLSKKKHPAGRAGGLYSQERLSKAGPIFHNFWFPVVDYPGPVLRWAVFQTNLFVLDTVLGVYGMSKKNGKGFLGHGSIPPRRFLWMIGKLFKGRHWWCGKKKNIGQKRIPHGQMQKKTAFREKWEPGRQITFLTVQRDQKLISGPDGTNKFYKLTGKLGGPRAPLPHTVS